jgi:TonB family protein
MRRACLLWLALACAPRTSDPGQSWAESSEAADTSEGCASRDRALAKGWKLAAFFGDFHCRIRATWPCSGFDPARRPLFHVLVGADGGLRGARLLSSCGDPLQDKAAEGAIRRAAPFSPPPPPMLTANGTAEIKTSVRCRR